MSSVPSPVLFESDDMLVINKSAGLIVDGPAFADRFGEAKPAHRLDKDTSGVLVLAKSEAALERLQAEFKARRAKKEYVALVYGVPKEKEGKIEQPLKRSSRYPMRRTVHPEGKAAVTEWRVEEEFTPSPSAPEGHSPSGRGRKYSLLRLFPLTGRTHQLRAHLHWLGHPIVGDKLYKFRKRAFAEAPARVERQMLHAEKLTILGQSFEAEMPSDFSKLLDDLRG